MAPRASPGVQFRSLAAAGARIDLAWEGIHHVRWRHRRFGGMRSPPMTTAASSADVEVAAKKDDAQSANSTKDARDDRMPEGIKYIVANEFAERFCFYGINAVLTIFLTRKLGMGQADATTWHSLFKTAAYFFPLVGAIVSDVFWGKFKTIITFSLVYASGCAVISLSPDRTGLLIGLTMVAFGTGGIKPCVSTNVGDQFTGKNQHLIERAFSYFYLAINAGSSISIYFCPELLERDMRRLTFGLPAMMMFFATLVFWLGRKKFAVVPPAGKAWAQEVFSKSGLKLIASLGVIYVFVACFWALWDQSNGQTWTLQAESSLMDKTLFPGFKILPAQIQVVNGLFILALTPVFSFVIYPLLGKFFKTTPLRRIGIGLFTIAASFVLVGRIEAQIQAGHTVSVWWQILAYVILTMSEVLVSITALEFSYKQAPLRIKSFIMALFLLSTSLGNMITAGVNQAIIRPLQAEAVEVGSETWAKIEGAEKLVLGQKIDFGGNTGIEVAKGDKTAKLSGTFLVGEVDASQSRVRLVDTVNRQAVVTTGSFTKATAKVSTYKLVGPEYFNFFALAMAGIAVLFIFYAMLYKEQTHLRTDDGADAKA